MADEFWLHGRAALALGQSDAARESLLKAIEAVEAQEEHSILWKILASLSEVEQASGHAELSNRLCDQARAVLDDIAAHAGDMRDVFLSQPALIQMLRENMQHFLMEKRGKSDKT